MNRTKAEQDLVKKLAERNQISDKQLEMELALQLAKLQLNLTKDEKKRNEKEIEQLNLSTDEKKEN